MTQLSQNLPWELANSRWASILNPIIALPFLNEDFGKIITSGSIGSALNIAGNTLTVLGSLLFPIGNWLSIFQVAYNGASGNGYMTAYFNMNPNSAAGNILGLNYGIAPIITATGVGGTITMFIPLNVITDTRYYLNVYVPSVTANTGGILGSIFGIKLS